MTQTATAIVTDSDSAAAGKELGRLLRDGLAGEVPDAVVVFASSQHDYPRVLEALAGETGTQTIVGSSSAGEFSHGSSGQGYVTGLAIKSKSIQFKVGLGRNLTGDTAAAARKVAENFDGI